MKHFLALSLLVLLVTGPLQAKTNRNPQAKENTDVGAELKTEKNDLQYMPETRESSQVVACHYLGLDETVSAKCLVGRVTLNLPYDKIDHLLHEKRYVQNFMDFVRDRDLARLDTTSKDIKARYLNDLAEGLKRTCLEKFEKDTGVRPDASYVKVFAPTRIEKSDSTQRDLTAECNQEPVTLFSRSASSSTTP